MRKKNENLKKKKPPEIRHLPTNHPNADLGSLKSLHTFLKKCLYLMLEKFEQIRIVQTTQNFELFQKKTFLTKR